MSDVLPVEFVVFKRLDKTTFKAMMGVNPPAGSGRGQRGIRLGRKPEVKRFFGDGASWQREVRAIGSDESATLRAEPQAARRREWRIMRQNPQLLTWPSA